MSRKRFTGEKIIGMLREAEVGLAQGKKIGEVCRSLGISEQSYYRWRREYGGLKTTQAKRMKDLGRVKFENRMRVIFSMRRYEQYGTLKSLYEWVYIVAHGGDSEKHSYSKREYKK